MPPRSSECLIGRDHSNRPIRQSNSREFCVLEYSIPGLLPGIVLLLATETRVHLTVATRCSMWQCGRLPGTKSANIFSIPEYSHVQGAGLAVFSLPMEG